MSKYTVAYSRFALTCGFSFPKEIAEMGEILLHHFITISVFSYLVL